MFQIQGLVHSRYQQMEIIIITIFDPWSEGTT